MGRAVLADEAGAVDGEPHRKMLDRHVVHDLIVAALQESRVDRAERLEAFGGEACRERHRMLLGNADIEGAVGESLAEDIDAGAARHRRGDGDDLVVLLRFLDQALSEYGRVGRRVGFRLGLCAGCDVELGDCVILVVRRFGGGVALALLCHHVNQDWPGRRIAHIGEHRQQMVEVVAVDRPDIEEAEFFKQRAAGDHAARIFLGAQRAILEELWKFVRQILQRFARRRIGLSGEQTCEIG